MVRLTSFGDSSINLLVSAYLLTNQAGTFLQMQNDLNLNVMDVMQKNNVDFASPPPPSISPNNSLLLRAEELFCLQRHIQRHHQSKP